MLITLRLTVRTLSDAAEFTRQMDWPALPVVGEEMVTGSACEPFVVIAVDEIVEEGHPVVTVESWDEPRPEDRAASFEGLRSELEDLAADGWTRCQE